MTLTHFLEFIAVSCGIVSIYFSTRASILVFPIGLVNTILYIYLSFSVGLYGEGSLNFYYTAMSIWGWHNWSKKKGKQELQITRLSKIAKLKMGAITLLLFLCLYFFLVSFTDSTTPLGDSLATSLAFVAMYLMAKKKIEHWLFWVLSDTVSIPLFFYQNLPITSFQFIVFNILAIIGFISWTKKLKAKEE